MRNLFVILALISVLSWAGCSDDHSQKNSHSSPTDSENPDTDVPDTNVPDTDTLNDLNLDWQPWDGTPETYLNSSSEENPTFASDADASG